MKIYIAGPMRGYPEFNAPAFREAARELRARGHEVFSPVEKDEEAGFDFSGKSGSLEEVEFDLRTALGDCLAWICAHADAVVLLPGWTFSLDANAEAATAQALGLLVRELEDM